MLRNNFMAKKKIKKSAKKAAKKIIKKAAKKAPAKKKTAKVARPAKKSTRKTVSRQESRLAVNPYLNFNGNCEEAFNYYKSVFGGQYGHVGRFKEMPPMEGMPLPAEYADKIMHISLLLPGGSVIMGSDSMEGAGGKITFGNNFWLSINARSRQEADKLFAALADGGNVAMPLQSTFWGSYFGMVIDRFGVQWMMSHGG